MTGKLSGEYWLLASLTPLDLAVRGVACGSGESAVTAGERAAAGGFGVSSAPAHDRVGRSRLGSLNHERTGELNCLAIYRWLDG